MRRTKKQHNKRKQTPTTHSSVWERQLCPFKPQGNPSSEMGWRSLSGHDSHNSRLFCSLGKGFPQNLYKTLALRMTCLKCAACLPPDPEAYWRKRFCWLPFGSSANGGPLKFPCTTLSQQRPIEYRPPGFTREEHSKAQSFSFKQPSEKVPHSFQWVWWKSKPVSFPFN